MSESSAQGSGGVGAVSTGCAEVALELLLPLAALATFWLLAVAVRKGAVTQRSRNIVLVLTAAFVTAGVLALWSLSSFPVGSNRPSFAVFLLTLVGQVVILGYSAFSVLRSRRIR